MSEQLVLSPSRIRKWVRCKRSYHWRYNRHFVRLEKNMPMSLGIIVSEVLESYYDEHPELRSTEGLKKMAEICLRGNAKLFLEINPNKERKGDWNRIVNIVHSLMGPYHAWAVKHDDFEVIQTETRQEIELCDGVSLLAIPDAIVLWEESRLVLEHKVRHKYQQGMFGIDYQSAGSCLVSNSIGTIYNILRYKDMKFFREVMIRSEHELEYFRAIYVEAGKDILTTPPERMYPSPFGRCSCEYWELCNAEQTGVDIDEIINSFYRDTHTKKVNQDGGKNE